jgi:hypothetical protein
VEATICDGRPWVDALIEEPVTMGFNGMMSDTIGKVLGTNISVQPDYLRSVSHGAARLVRTMDTYGIPSWLSNDLFRQGRLFALPVLTKGPLRIGSYDIPIAAPPLPPSKYLRELLKQLPVQVTVNDGYPDAEAFALSHGLVLHWVLHELGANRE